MGDDQSYNIPTVTNLFCKHEIIADDEFSLAPEVSAKIDSLKGADLDDLKIGFQEILIADQKRHYQHELDKLRKRTDWKISAQPSFSYEVDPTYLPSLFRTILMKEMNRYAQSQLCALKTVQSKYQSLVQSLHSSINTNEKSFVYDLTSMKLAEDEALQKFKNNSPLTFQVSELFVRQLLKETMYKNANISAHRQLEASSYWTISITCDIEYP